MAGGMKKTGAKAVAMKRGADNAMKVEADYQENRTYHFSVKNTIIIIDILSVLYGLHLEITHLNAYQVEAKKAAPAMKKAKVEPAKPAKKVRC